MANQFNNVSKLRPGRSVFDLSYEKKFTCDMGQLIVACADEYVPGDSVKIGNEIVLRWQPLVAPILHEVNIYVHYFFVPYRLLWDEWEDFITGGPQGDLEPIPPTWIPDATSNAEGTLWDYMGFPINVIPDGAYPLSFPRTAYNFIYNEYYRDQTLQEPVELDQNNILYRAWEKDYFTSSLPWQQRSEIAPSLPIAGTTSAVWPASLGGTDVAMEINAATGPPAVPANDGTKWALENNTIDLSSATSFDIADLREVVQVQKFLERNARVGARYTEFLQAHFGMSPKDDRLDRPEYIGGTKSSVIISEVLSTVPTDLGGEAQGTLAGHGITADRNFAGSYKVKEFGLIMGIMSVMPRSAYQQGINRQWLRRTKYDFYFPEFAHLSEQGIEQAEIYATGVAAENTTLFGYQGKYDEMRVKQNMVANWMRTNATISFDYWHLARAFESAPILDETFISTEGNIRKDIFAVPSEPGLIVNFANKIRAVRPMPAASDPGLMDHF